MKIEKEINYTPANNISSQNMWQMPSAIVLIPVVYVVSLELKYSGIVTRCTLTLHKHIKLHPCIQQAENVSNLPWCYSLLSVPLEMDCQV